MSTEKLKVEIPPQQMCLKCGARRSPDSHPDYPMCEAHLIHCEKCGATNPEPDSDPLMCVDCMAKKGGGNDPETADEEMRAMEARDLNEDEGDK